MWLQVIDWIILCRCYRSLRHYLGQPPGEISISPPPKRLATGETGFRGHRQTLCSLLLIFPIHYFDLLFFTHTVEWMNLCTQKEKTLYNVQQSLIYHEECHQAYWNTTCSRRSKCCTVKTCPLFFLLLHFFLSWNPCQITGLIFIFTSWPPFGRSRDLLRRLLNLFIFPSSLQTPKTDSANQCLTPRFNLGMSLVSQH